MASYQDFSGKYTGIFSEFSLCPQQPLRSAAMPFSGCYDDDDCNGFCPECSEIIRCEAYEELKEEWDSFYM